MVYHELKEAHRSFLLLLVFLLMCGAMALPMLPIWQGGLRAVAGMVLVLCLGAGVGRRLLGTFLTALLIAAAVFWLYALSLDAFAHVIHALTDVFGQPLGILPDGLLLLYDLVCIVGLAALVVCAQWWNDRPVALFAGCAALFWLWGLLTPVFAATGTEPMRLAQMMTGLSGWATWVYWALLPLLLVRCEADTRKLLAGIGIGGLFVGGVIGLQWLLGDFSYVLDTLDIADYFYRVRGTDYYHAGAVFAVILAAMALLALCRQDGRPSWALLGSVFLVAMAILNNTRALSLALLVGLGVVLLGMLRQRRWGLAVVVLIGLATVSTTVLYVKPVSGLAPTKAISSPPPAREVASEEAAGKKSVETTDKAASGEAAGKKSVETIDKTALGDVIAANSSRAQLAVIGMGELPSVLLTGQGVGTLELPLEGNTFNGMRSTYSSHTLYLDIALMAGVPALVLVFALFAMAVWRVADAGLVRVRVNHAYRAPVQLAVLLMFAVASFFLPQERNELIGLAFSIAALAMLRPTSDDGGGVCGWDVTPSWRRWGVALVGVGTAGWTILTSPAYVFPAIEFTARHGRELAGSNDRVMVTEPVMKPLLEFLLRLRGVERPWVFLLPDDPYQFPESGAWILWSPARGGGYPNIRQHFGSPQFRQGGQAPSIILPPSWRVVPSAQPTVIFLYAGGRSDFTIPLRELADVIPLSGVRSILTPQEAREGWGYAATGVDGAAWQIRLRGGLPRPLRLDVEAKRPGQVAGRLVSTLVVDIGDGSEPISLSHSDSPPGTLLNLYGRLPTWPNQAPRADVAVSRNVLQTSARFVADMNYGSVVSWEHGEETTFVFNMHSLVEQPLRVYRLVAIGHRSMPSIRRYSWILEGSRDGEVWNKLDEQSGQVLSQDPGSPSAFFLGGRDRFQYYRFRFLPNAAESAKFGGMAEIELYPAPYP